MKRKQVLRSVFCTVMMVFTITQMRVPTAGAQQGNPPSPPPMPTGYEETKSPERLKVNVNNVSSAITNHVGQAVTPRAMRGMSFRRPLFGLGPLDWDTGLSAGDSLNSIGAWGNITYTASEDDSDITRSDGDLYNLILGADYRITDKIVAGMAFSYETMDRTTDYNAGDVESDGFTLSPYFGILFNDYVGMDINLGYSWISSDQTRNKDLRYGPRPITSSPDLERMFVSVNVNGYHNIGNWYFTGSLGYLYAEEEQDAFTESNGERVPGSSVDLGQITLGAETSYAFDSAEPYLTLEYEYDTTYDEELTVFGEDKTGIDYDSDGFTFGLGLRFLILEFMQGSIGTESVFGRDNYSEYSLFLNLRFDF